MNIKIDSLAELKEFVALLNIHHELELLHLANDLRKAANTLKAIVAANSVKSIATKDNVMQNPQQGGQQVKTANPGLEQLRQQVENATTVMQSATTLISGISDRINSAVQQALTNGATQEELQPIIAEAQTLQQAASDLANAVQTNTPQPNPTPPNG